VLTAGKGVNFRWREIVCGVICREKIWRWFLKDLKNKRKKPQSSMEKESFTGLEFLIFSGSCQMKKEGVSKVLFRHKDTKTQRFSKYIYLIIIIFVSI
jgi:hypothetical protein